MERLPEEDDLQDTINEHVNKNDYVLPMDANQTNQLDSGYQIAMILEDNLSNNLNPNAGLVEDVSDIVSNQILEFQASFDNLISLLSQTIQIEVEGIKESGLTDSQIKSLKKMKMGRSRQVCAICLNNFNPGETIRKLPCRHIYHDKCVVPWLKNKTTCPTCRTNLLDTEVKSRSAN